MSEFKIALQLRVDETVHKKVKFIADLKCRSLNAQLEYFILKGIREYEELNGTIFVKD